MMSDKIYVDSREQDRANRFIKALNKYMEKYNGKSDKIGGMKPIKDKWKQGDSYYKITELELGDYIYNNVIIEYKDWEDFKISHSNGKLNLRVHDMITQTKFKDKVLLVNCNNDFRHYNNGGFYKPFGRYGGEINCILVRNEQDAFNVILYLFRLNADHIGRPPKTTIRKESWIIGILYNSGKFSYNQSKEIVKKTGITTLPQLLTFFSKDTEYIHKALSIPRVTVNKIDDFKKMLNGEPIL